MTDDTIRNRLRRRIDELTHEQLLAMDRFLSQFDQPNHSVSPRTNSVTMTDDRQTDHWPHAPLHRISQHGTFIVTAGTLYKRHRFQTPYRLNLLQGKLLELARCYRWQLEAWAVFSNHYHFVAHSSPDSGSLNDFLSQLHVEAASFVNHLDNTVGNSVWHNYWETQLTYERSYFARLNYVHQNPVKHGLVRQANEYPWCSASWFERTATPSQVKTIYSFRTDSVRVLDDFESMLVED